MLRLSSLLPIIEVTPVQSHEQAKKDYRQPGNGKAVAPGNTSKQALAGAEPPPDLTQLATPESELRLTPQPGGEPALIPALPGRRQTQNNASDAETRPHSEPPGSNPASPAGKTASYGIVGLLNPLLQEAPGPAPSHETRFSPLASLLASLRNENPQAKNPAPVHSSAPLVSQPPGNPAMLAIALRDAISQSGLFYESHLEQWLNGTRTLEVLKQEPQGSLPPALNFNPADTAMPSTPQTGPLITQEPLAWLQQNLVQQLSILNNPTLAWSGQVWPDQHVAIQTRRENVRSAEGETPWVTRLTLEMPRLGRMDVTILLDGQGVDVDIKAENPGAESRLQHDQAGLLNRLTDAGCRLRRMSVRKADGQS